MTCINEKIIDSIHQIENLLFCGDILNETSSQPLINLRNQLKQIDDEYDLNKKDEIESLIPILDYFEINSFCHFIKLYSSVIPSTLVTVIFDIVRLKIYNNLIVYPALTDYYFNLSLTYLIADSTIDYLIDTKNILSNLDEEFLHLFSSICSRSIYVKTKISYSIYASHKNIPTFFQLNNSTERLLKALITYLNNYFFNNHQKYQSYISIFKWLINMANVYGFVPYLVNTGYPYAISQWMSIEKIEFKDISLELWSLVVTLLHNLVRHWMGVEALNKLKMIDTLKEWRENYISVISITDYDENDQDILMAYYLVYSALLEPKELKKESISSIRKVLDYILEQTVKAFDSIDLTSGAYNVCEYLDGLAKFVVNDTFLIYTISYEHIYELFTEKFLLFDTIYELTALNTIICASLYTIFWSISFLPEYSVKLKFNAKFVSSIEQRAKTQSMDEHAVVMRRAAKGILFNLGSTHTDMQSIEDNHNDEDNSKVKVMISYAHKDTTFCKKLVTKMQERFQGDIWVDFNKLSPQYEDDWEEIAKAITRCDVILMIVTENYCSSKSCRREVIHADKRNKRMIPIYQGKDYKADDWFEIRVGSATWVRFGDKKNDEEVMEILLGLINVLDKSKKNDEKFTSSNKSHLNIKSETNTINMINTQTVETISSASSRPIIEIPDIQSQSETTVSNATPTSSIEQWTCEEIQQWLHLPPSTLQLSSGRALIAYMNLLSYDDAQYDEYEHRMRHNGISREQFSNLISSFASVRSLNNISTITPNKFFDEWTREEIKYWFQQNNLSDSLLNTLDFVDGSQLITYGKLIIDSPVRIDQEYGRLRNHIGNDRFHLNEYARLLSGLKKIVNQSKSKEEPVSCNIL
ncbi:unnamed protein product [Rotaria socialis]|uniref:TIR domain-containing protein n=1 Tax=Rotaria socialis TaxID=392032 RepID=A0A820PXL8_9BILA|nr:unnamed protein product [Rotaria socialis]CAF4411752.1 unnamed protein product [Rotaria socialis]